jgi:hypothetical protein
VHETEPKKRRYSAEQLRELGYVFTVRVRIRGERGQRLPLRWSMYARPSRRRLPGPAYNQLAVTFVPAASEHARTWPVWVPRPPTAGRYFVRFVLFDLDGRPVDTRDSAAFEYAPPPSR